MAQGRSSLIAVPREHGAWAMLIIPYIVSAIIAEGSPGTEIAGLIGILLLFFSRAPLALLLKTRAVDGSFGSQPHFRWLNFAIFSITGTLVLLYLAVANGLWRLVVVAAVGAMLFFVHEWLVWRRRERSVMGELVGVAILTLTAPVAVQIASDSPFWPLTICLWLLNASYFASSVFYVKMRLRTSTRRRKPVTMRAKAIAAKGSIVYMAIVFLMLWLLAIVDAIPNQVIVAYVPMFIYQAWGVLSGAPGITLKVEGVVQTILAAIFAILLVAAY